MSSDDNGIHASVAQILELTLTHGRDLGRLEGHVLRIDSQLTRVEGNVATINAAYVEQNKAIGMLQQTCLQRGRRCSEMRKKLDIIEDTGVHHMIEDKARWAMTSRAWKLLTVLCGLLLTVTSIYLNNFFRRGG